MIYIYRQDASDGARQLAVALGGRKISDPHRNYRLEDRVVAWGEHLRDALGVPTLGGTAPIRSKFTDAETLRSAGVATIEVTRTRPAPAVTMPLTDPAATSFTIVRDLVEDFLEDEDFDTATMRGSIYLQGLTDIANGFNTFIRALQREAPVARPAPQVEWIGRSNSHVGGDDLLTPTQRPDYWSKKLTFTTEYRVHSFMGRSIRAGQKVLRDGFTLTGQTGLQTASPWIRSHEGGWRIAYDGSVKQRHRDIAHAAVSALGLDFGAVDIGEKADGSVIVLEVNRAPGLEGGSVDAYARAIQSWAAGA